MNERKIKKETLEVLFKLSNGNEIQGNVFLRLHEAHHTGPQKVWELLNEKEPFIPVETPQGVVFLNSFQVVTAMIRSELEEDELAKLGGKHTIRIYTTQEEEIVGDIFVSLPEDRHRVKDYLNQSMKFVLLFLPDKIVYINKKFIISVQD